MSLGRVLRRAGDRTAEDSGRTLWYCPANRYKPQHNNVCTTSSQSLVSLAYLGEHQLIPLCQGLEGCVQITFGVQRLLVFDVIKADELKRRDDFCPFLGFRLCRPQLWPPDLNAFAKQLGRVCWTSRERSNVCQLWRCRLLLPNLLSICSFALRVAGALTLPCLSAIKPSPESLRQLWTGLFKQLRNRTDRN